MGDTRISIHALREEGDCPVVSFTSFPAEFLSSPAAGRATRVSALMCWLMAISIHALREEGDSLDKAGDVFSDISIHALREEGDKFYTQFRVYCAYFYPRPPRGGRPHNAGDGAVHVLISIHALREEGDNAFTANERAALLFLSTPSARRATGCSPSPTRP